VPDHPVPAAIGAQICKPRARIVMALGPPRGIERAGHDENRGTAMHWRRLGGADFRGGKGTWLARGGSGVFMAQAARSVRRRDLIGSIVGFLVVLGALVMMDPRVGYHLRTLVSGGTPSEVGEVGDRLSALGDALMIALRDQSIGHAPLLVFSVVALVLVFFMVRT
jgi:hypothetical protein